MRNTSTCVKKTSSDLVLASLYKKHLHVRGEDLSIFSKIEPASETPPRAWRRQLYKIKIIRITRNTSTCVEKTMMSLEKKFESGKHLHVRGKDQLYPRKLRHPIQKHLHVRGEDNRTPS